MVVRAGDALPGVLIIAKGSLRVEALGDVVETRTEHMVYHGVGSQIRRTE